MSASKKKCTKGCKLTEISMGHCGHRNCPGLGVLDRVYTTHGNKVMKKKATEKKLKPDQLRAAVIEAFGPDASDSNIGSVADDLVAAFAKASLKPAKASLKPTTRSSKRRPPTPIPGSSDKAGRRHRRTRKVRKSSKHRKRRHSTRRRRSGRKSRRR